MTKLGIMMYSWIETRHYYQGIKALSALVTVLIGLQNF